jgi:hypothetical protein
LLLYLVLYIQDVLGYGALATGERLLFASAGILATSALAGRLSSHMPVRFLIGPGLLAVAVGLLLMRGLDADSSWTHLVPGLLVSGAGVGLINPPLASTAVGVVRPQQAGMASGISSTFRQVGIATGIALLGSLFSTKVHDTVVASVAHLAGLSGKAGEIATAVQSGSIARVAGHLPAGQRAQVLRASATAFTSGLNEILLVGAIIAGVSGIIAFATIRSKDFAHQGDPGA